MFGTVHKGPAHTRFRLEIKLENDCTFYEVAILRNEELQRYPKLYGYTLDRMTEKLATRMAERA